MSARVYLETTIPSYLASRPSRDLLIAAHQRLTWDWWDSKRAAFDLCISEIVIQECSGGDATLAHRRLELLRNIRLLPLTTEIPGLARELVADGVIPAKAATDALHVAVATIHSCDFLLTWNCTHIANAQIQRSMARVVKRLGFELPVICTPEELLA